MNFRPDVLARLKRANPAMVLLGGVVAGSAMLLLSIALDFAFAKTGARHTGYAEALNWSIAFPVMVPLFAYFACRFAANVEKRIGRLGTMVVDEEGTQLADGSERLVRMFRGRTKKVARVADLLFVLAVVVSIGEWVGTSAGPLLAGWPVHEPDWSTAAIGLGLSARLINSAFSLLAFLMQGVFVGMLLAHLTQAIAFSQLLDELTDRGRAPHLVPDLEIADPRFGFERIGMIVEELLFAVGAGFICFWLSRLQNLFLHDPGASSSVALFFDGAATIGTDPWSLLPWLLETRKDVSDFSSLMVLLGSMLLVLVSVFLPLVSVRRCAIGAREKAEDLLRRGWAPGDLSREEAETKLRTMAFWPVHYPTLNGLVALAVLCLASLVMFRLGTVMFVWILVAILTRVARWLGIVPANAKETSDRGVAGSPAATNLRSRGATGTRG